MHYFRFLRLRIVLLNMVFAIAGCAYPDILEGYDGAENNNRTLFAQLEALADLKFTYVISFQMFGSLKSSGDPHAQDILDLMNRYYFTLNKLNIPTLKASIHLILTT